MFSVIDEMGKASSAADLWCEHLPFVLKLINFGSTVS